jgi:hypothetical protein
MLRFSGRQTIEISFGNHSTHTFRQVITPNELFDLRLDILCSNEAHDKYAEYDWQIHVQPLKVIMLNQDIIL